MEAKVLEMIRRHDDVVLSEPPDDQPPKGMQRCARCQELFEEADVTDLHISLGVCGDICGSIVTYKMREGLERLEKWIPHRIELASMTGIDLNVRMAMLRTGIFAIRNGCTVVER